VRQIEKNAVLALSAPQRDIAKYEKLISVYGNIAPAIVATEGGVYTPLDGHARIEAYRRVGVGDIPTVVVQSDSEEEKFKLSLFLSTVREQGSPLGEGILIENLVENYGQTLGALSKYTGRSKSWLSRRQTMARNLSPAVEGLVLGGTVCARTAEEIAKLPKGEQAKFASNVIRGGLNKNDVCKLVKMYRSPGATLETCRAIIDSPELSLPAIQQASKIHRSHDRKTSEGQLVFSVNFALGLLDKICIMLVSGGAEVAAAQDLLLDLHIKMRTLGKLIIEYINAGVSPGEQEGQTK
jgi:ParB-like chromosome segregation protein Spo0J